MMPPKEIIVTEMGMIAYTKLSRERDASVMGMTSRGLFLRLPSGWVVFLSPDLYRGPLTLNYSAGADDFGFLRNGLPARVYPGHIHFPEAGLVIHTGQASPWQAPPPPREALPPGQRRSQLALVASLLLAKKQASEFSALIPVVLGAEEMSETQGNPVYQLVERLQVALKDGKVAAITESLEAILGLGAGLTPSGDDVAMGCLLALTRWGRIQAPNLEIQALAQDVARRSYRKTTTLSANLIECASQGQANERLILALDGIMCGHPDAPTCADYLEGWGSTSGLDVLTGVALVL
jgi:hypothetical protein